MTAIKKRWVGDDEVIISRAEYEALMAAAKAILEEHGAASRYRAGCKCCEAVAALRVAGIPSTSDQETRESND